MYGAPLGMAGGQQPCFKCHGSGRPYSGLVQCRA